MPPPYNFNGGTKEPFDAVPGGQIDVHNPPTTFPTEHARGPLLRKPPLARCSGDATLAQRYRGFRPCAATRRRASGASSGLPASRGCLSCWSGGVAWRKYSPCPAPDRVG